MNRERVKPTASDAGPAAGHDTTLPATSASLAYEVRESGIHGRGLFATRVIAADTLIGEATGTATQRNGAHVLWYEDERGVQRALRVRNDLRFANHARPGNAGFFGTELWSIAAIAPGAEITLDYGPGW